MNLNHIPIYCFILTFSDVYVFPKKGKGRLNLGASPQAPGIYRIADQGRANKDKTEAVIYNLRLFPGLLQALGSLPSRCPILLQNCG